MRRTAERAPSAPTHQGLLSDLEHAPDMRKSDAVAAEHTRDGPNVMPHAPPLVSGVVADGRVRQTSGAGNRCQCRDERDKSEIDLWQAAPFEK